MAWRLAKALDVLRTQINTSYPKRGKASDGTIGNTEHAARTSDHNPNAAGVVTAMDITHDPTHGVNAGKLAEILLASRDPRIKYIISNRRIAASYVTGSTPAWQWRPYSGTNPHDKHFHISVSTDPAKYDSTSPWQIGGIVPAVQPARTVPVSKNTYDEALRRVLAEEGGYVNHPSDPGGPTNFGITLADYRKHIKANGTAADVKRMTVDQAKVIYKSKYWDAMNCDALPAGLDYAVFDYGVNSGIGRAPKILQKIVGVSQDGDIGPSTLSAISARNNTKALINALCDERMAYLKTLKIWPTFGKGWEARVKRVRAAALAMAPAQSVITPEVATGTGIVVAGGGAVVHQATKPDTSWGMTLFIAGAVIAVAVIAFVIIRSKRQANEA